MFLELIAVLFAGFAGAGLMLLAARVSGGRLPKWVVPLGAGAAMIGTTISSEYSWYARTASALPPELTVAQSVPARAWWRPWTFAVPMTERFVAVNTDTLLDNADQPGLYLAQVYFFGRWKPVTQLQVMVDCPGARRADPTLGDDSPPVWRDTGAEDPIVKTVCEAA